METKSFSISTQLSCTGKNKMRMTKGRRRKGNSHPHTRGERGGEYRGVARVGRFVFQLVRVMSGRMISRPATSCAFEVPGRLWVKVCGPLYLLVPSSTLHAAVKSIRGRPPIEPHQQAHRLSCSPSSSPSSYRRPSPQGSIGSAGRTNRGRWSTSFSLGGNSPAVTGRQHAPATSAALRSTLSLLLSPSADTKPIAKAEMLLMLIMWAVLTPETKTTDIHPYL